MLNQIEPDNTCQLRDYWIKNSLVIQQWTVVKSHYVVIFTGKTIFLSTFILGADLSSPRPLTSTPGQRPPHPEDPGVAAGLLRPQQAAREGHAAGPADGLGRPGGHQPPALLQVQPGHLRPHPRGPAPPRAAGAGRLHGQRPGTPSGESQQSVMFVEIP